MRQMFDEKLDRFDELERQMADPAVSTNSSRMAAAAREHGTLAKLATKYRRFKQLVNEIRETKEMLEGDDEELKQLAEEALPELKQHREKLWQELLDMTVGGEDANRLRSVMEIRAGTGGDEASLFAGDLFRMYKKHCETRGWKVEILEASPTELGGFKTVVLRECLITSATPSNATVSGAPSATFSGFSLQAGAEPKEGAEVTIP